MSEHLSRPAQLLRELIRCPSVTPEEGGALAFLEYELARLEFDVDRIVFSEEGAADVDNLYARLGAKGPHLMFAGHTDVVPPGNEAAWRQPPFAGEIVDGEMIGRGAVDMKGGIACFLAAVEAYLQKNGELPGSVSFLITGDEEGPSVNGTEKLLKWAAKRGETWDAAIVGEPTNSSVIGDEIKRGRRGVMSGKVTINGKQGHSAYPQLADNPVNGLMDLLGELLATPFDEGTAEFQPTNLEVTSVDVGNQAVNVIPGEASAVFNVRFSDRWDGESLRVEILRRFTAGAKAAGLRTSREEPVEFNVEWMGRVSPAFLTNDNQLIGTLTGAIDKVTGKQPAVTTGGGTSDARYIKNYCPVIEFGLVGTTMHQTDERTSLTDLDQLTAVYLQFMEDWYAQI